MLIGLPVRLIGRPVRATITLYPIWRPVRATITLYPIGRPVRAAITLYPTGRPVRATVTLYPIGRPVRATITLYPIGRPVRANITLYIIYTALINAIWYTQRGLQKVRDILHISVVVLSLQFQCVISMTTVKRMASSFPWISGKLSLLYTYFIN